MARIIRRRHLTASLLNFATHEDSVAWVMRLIATDFEGWVGLYRVLEAIAGDVNGWSNLEKRGWAHPRDIRNFKHTAGSPHAVGELARHGKEVGEPPTNPMTIDDAVELVRTVAMAWLEFRYGHSI